MGSDIVVGDVQGYLHWLDQKDGHFVLRTRIRKAPILVTPKVVGNDIYALDSGILTVTSEPWHVSH